MSTESDPLTLATEALARHNFASEWGEVANPWDEQPAEIKRGWLSEALGQAKVVAEHFQPRTIATEDERQAITDGTIVRSSAGTTAHIFGGRAYFFETTNSTPAQVLALPLTVLWEPAVSA